MPTYFANQLDEMAIDRILRWLKDTEVSTPETDYRKTSMEDYRFYAGKQDTREVIASLAAQKRPASVYNEVKPKIDMLVGLAAQTKHDVTVAPTGANDGALSEVMQNVMKYFRKQLRMTRKELECFEHMVKGGRSLLFFYINKDNPFKPEIKVKRFPGRQFYLDPESQEYGISEDSRYLFLETWLDEDALKERWPGFDISQYQSYINSNQVDLPSFFNEARNKYRVMECWYYKMTSVVWFVNPINQEVESLSPKEFSKFAKVLREGLPVGPNGSLQKFQVPDVTEGLKKEWFYRIFSGNTILEEGKSPYKYQGIPGVLYGAYKDEDSNTWFGAITMQKDPQRGINAMRRQLSHLLQTLPKGTMIHETGAIMNIDEYEKRHADPSFHLEVSPNSIEKVKFQQQPQISPIYSSFSAEMSQSMKDASGIQNEMMGVETSSRTPGVTTRLRQETSLAVLYSLYDNYKESRNEGNRILLKLIQQYITYPVVIRIDEENAELLQINTQLNPESEGFNDITAVEYDLVLGETVETDSTRALIMEQLTEYSHNNPGMIPADVIFEYSDLPFKAKQRIRESQAQQQQAQQLEADRNYQLELLKIQQKVDAAETDNIIRMEEMRINKETKTQPSAE